ncbi:ankyrin repeat-containing domain protein [Podospora australis]|uniref:Ankyrin repeat-containing domain protein n=1 Tax=Podospora australis TaxID=1536484 RepID=A0AAN7AF91_9PEZI|nr:ankyrin repeat-containing domain protein [Podospora australis]
MLSGDGDGVVKLLLRRGANPYFTDATDGNTPLYRLAMHGWTAAGWEMLNQTRNCGLQAPHDLLHIRNKQNQSALHVASRYDQSVFAEMLLKDFYRPDCCGGACFFSNLNCGSDLNARDVATGETPLITVVRRFQPTVVNKLVNIGAEISVMDKGGQTAIEHVRVQSQRGVSDIYVTLRQVEMERNKSLLRVQNAQNGWRANVLRLGYPKSAEDLVPKGEKKDYNSGTLGMIVRSIASFSSLKSKKGSGSKNSTGSKKGLAAEKGIQSEKGIRSEKGVLVEKAVLLEKEAVIA